MILSVVIPAYNEEGSITETVSALYEVLHREGIDHEIVVINDNSKDRTLEILKELQHSIPTLGFFTNTGRNGFGYAVRYGLERFTGDCVA
ncbi:MAG TPA: glycosyltransferase family 2 protein, partial [Puia sp.]